MDTRDYRDPQRPRRATDDYRRSTEGQRRRSTSDNRQSTSNRGAYSRDSRSGDSYSRQTRTRNSYSRESSARPRTNQRPMERAGYEQRRQAGQRPSSARRPSSDMRPRGDGYAQRPRTRNASRNVYVGRQPSVSEQAASLLSANPWIQRGALVLLAIIAILLVANMVSCIGGALAPHEDQATANVASSSSVVAEESASGSASASESTTATPEGVVSPWTESGYFSTGDSALDNYVKDFCDQHSTEGKSFEENAYDTNLVVSTQADYVERENNQSPWGPDWDVEYAKQFFEAGNSGNCYNFAAVTQFILQYFGYEDAEGQPCIVELESGNWGDHGLVFLTNKANGKRAIVDDAMGTNGWMLDIDVYNYDVRNINQNATVKGNVDAIDDEPMQIPPGELTE